ncbi:Ceramide synthase 4 [Porphyridium purpureum]|uniref:Ceramide synthase 4 n=1 Tax=Porphyridium purpureum TaxID=35688 RepID=A0A5J4YJB6_PORPP|nr:Ceramide synthase 4 [Porphyridium purpureum]KAA8492065.1 Ceramide synthase 4 [Porphyridium purpureum]|eukprot:POR8206..scf267_23
MDLGTMSGVPPRYAPDMVRFYTSLMREIGQHADPSKPELLSPHVALWKDAPVSLVVASALFFFRWLVERRIFPRLFQKFDARKRAKLSENAFYTIFYICSFAFGVSVYSRENWSVQFMSKEKMFDLFTDYPPAMSTDLRFYYLAQLGFYIGCLVFLNMDTRRSDYVQYIIHHAATTILVSGSYVTGYVRVGVIVLILHDVGDIFLYGAKTMHYLGLAPFDTILFVIFMVVFYISRLVFLPRVVYATVLETFLIAAMDPQFNEWVMYWHVYTLHWFVFCVLLCVLIVLHTFWFNLILRVAYREVMQPGKISQDGDIRSDSERLTVIRGPGADNECSTVFSDLVRPAVHDMAPQKSPEEPSAPQHTPLRSSERRKCHAARDAYLACVDTVAGDTDEKNKACSDEWTQFQADCPATWVSYFIKQHVQKKQFAQWEAAVNQKPA